MYLITNRHLCSKDRYMDVLKEASYNGIEYIILREKDLDIMTLEKLYLDIRKNINKDTKIIINNNLDLYMNINCDGIHLSYERYFNEYKDNLDIHKNNKIVGVSTHNIEEVESLSNTNIDYIFLSHIYETKCKEGLAPKGVDLLKKAQYILKESKIKLVALGGILPYNCKNTLKYCDDIAVMSTIMSSNNVKGTIYEYLHR